MGFGARVVERSNRMKDKGKSGALLYFYNIFASLMGYKAQKADIEIDGKAFRPEGFFHECGHLQIQWRWHDPCASCSGR